MRRKIKRPKLLGGGLMRFQAKLCQAAPAMVNLKFFFYSKTNTSEIIFFVCQRAFRTDVQKLVCKYNKIQYYLLIDIVFIWKGKISSRNETCFKFF